LTHRRISSAAAAGSCSGVVANPLDIDADLIHVRQSRSSQPLRRILVRNEVLQERAEAGVRSNRRCPRQLLDAGNDLGMMEMLLDGDDSQWTPQVSDE
jgi:hypothetical protein